MRILYIPFNYHLSVYWLYAWSAKSYKIGGWPDPYFFFLKKNHSLRERLNKPPLTGGRGEYGAVSMGTNVRLNLNIVFVFS